MSEEDERAHGALVLKWARRIWGNGKARSWSHAIDLAATYAGESKQSKPKDKGKTGR
jgi:hypothetical protein